MTMKNLLELLKQRWRWILSILHQLPGFESRTSLSHSAVATPVGWHWQSFTLQLSISLSLR